MYRSALQPLSLWSSWTDSGSETDQIAGIRKYEMPRHERPTQADRRSPPANNINRVEWVQRGAADLPARTQTEGRCSIGPATKVTTTAPRRSDRYAGA